MRGGRGRVTAMVSDSTGQVIGCQGTDTQIELFYFCSDDEAHERLKKRLKKERRKERKENPMETDEISSLNVENQQLSMRDEVKRLPVLKLPYKPKSLHLVLGNGGELRVVVTFANNTIGLYTVQMFVKHSEPRALRSITTHGHHSEVRAVSFSSDNLAMVSGSAESIKLWNRPTLTCLRTIETG